MDAPHTRQALAVTGDAKTSAGNRPRFEPWPVSGNRGPTSNR